MDTPHELNSMDRKSQTRTACRILCALSGGLFLACASTGCQDSRVNVYEFIEIQKQAEEEQFAQTPKLPRKKTAAQKQQLASAGTDARKGAAKPSAAKTQTNTAPAGPVTYAGEWKYDERSAMWTFEEARRDGQPVILAGHTSSGRPPESDDPDDSADTADAEHGFDDADHADMMPADEAIDTAAREAAMKEVYTEFHRPYRVGPGDVLRVSLTGLTGIEMLMEPTEVLARINRAGRIHLPLVGAVSVGDMEIEDAEKAIQDAYIPKYVSSLGLSVEINEYQTTDVVVHGAAELPGIVKLNRCQRDVLHAVVAAGGMTQDASGTVILQRLRNPHEKVELNVHNTHHLKTALAMEPLENGDIVHVVAAQPNTIFVGGLVNSPGPKEFPPGTKVNALQALAAGGGVNEAVLPNEATLVRRLPNGEDVFVRLDLDKTRRGIDPNVELAPGDIFWVPETFGTRLMDFVNRTFFLRAGMTVTYNVTGIEFLNRRGLQGSRVGNNNIQNTVDPLGFLVP